MNLIHKAIPPVSPEFYETLRKAFRPIVVTPNTRLEDIMYNAGTQAVIDWIGKTAISVYDINNNNNNNTDNSIDTKQVIKNTSLYNILYTKYIGK